MEKSNMLKVAKGVLGLKVGCQGNIKAGDEVHEGGELGAHWESP